jgi:PAS domain S-box-containing protein
LTETGSDPLAASPPAAVVSRIESRLTVGLILVLLALGIVTFLNFRALNAFTSGSRLVSDSHQVLETMESVYASLNQAIASVRLYVITADDRELQQRENALADVNRNLTRLEGLVSDNPVQVSLAQQLRVLVSRRGDYLREVIRLRKTDGFLAAQALVENPSVRELSTRMYSTLEHMETEERRLLEVRTAAERQRLQYLYESAALLLVLVVAASIYATWRLRRELIDRRQLTEELGESRLFLESILEHIPSMVVVKRASDLRFVRINKAGETLSGLRREDLIGRNNEELFSPEVAAAYTREDRASLQSTDVRVSPEETLHLGPGKTITLHSRRILMPDSAGNPAYMVALAEDISERKAAEQKIRELNADLEQKNLALQVSIRELESFSYSVSHDLRAPLRAIASFGQMLEEDFGADLDPEAIRYLRVIRDGSARMNQLIDDLLAFSRVGRQALRLSIVDMRALAEDALHDVLQSQPAPNARIHVDALPPCRGDPGVLRQVWINLIANAIKYSAKRELPQVHIGGESNGRESIYFVQDNGAGFDMRYYNKLFGVFQRLHHDSEFPGTGVGLAIVQRIVVRHGGRVWASGAPDQGARFSFALPSGEQG